MYRCDQCNRLSPPSKPEILRFTYRDVTYDDGNKGREIKRKLKLCPKCAKAFDKTQAVSPKPEKAVKPESVAVSNSPFSFLKGSFGLGKILKRTN